MKEKPELHISEYQVPERKTVERDRSNTTPGAVHWNGNLFCAIDVETTGLTPGFHDIIQIAIIPLTPAFEPSRTLMPFEMRIQPKRPQNASLGAFKVNGESLQSAMIHGVEAWDAVDRFEEWFKSLHLPERKKIIPLGHNYTAFDRLMIVDWLGGWLNYDFYFDYMARDTMLAAIILNDMAYWADESCPFARVGLGPVGNYLRLERGKKHDAMADALLTAAIYKRMMRHIRAHMPDGIMNPEEKKLSDAMRVFEVDAPKFDPKIEHSQDETVRRVLQQDIEYPMELP